MFETKHDKNKAIVYTAKESKEGDSEDLQSSNANFLLPDLTISDNKVTR